MRASLATVRAAIASRFLPWITIVVGLTALYHLGLLVALIVRFGEWPNYLTFYNWPANVARIFASTPSWADAVAIARDEWLLEVGYINHKFGLGISEWSMTLVPLKIAQVVLLGILVATISVLAARRACMCRGLAQRGALALSAGTGALSVGLTATTTSWVVCCATPTWIVSLAMLGMSVSTAIWLEPIGPWLSLAGFAMLLGTVLLLSAYVAREDEQMGIEQRPHAVEPGRPCRRDPNNEPHPA